jgi:hypothetical protein
MSEEKNAAGKRLRRFDIKKLLANPELRKNLIVRSTVATQAREGIDISEKQAETSYYVVTEGERAAFFGLVPFRSDAGENDGRHVEFVNCLSGKLESTSRLDISIEDFLSIDASPISYDKIALVGHLFRDFPAFGSATTSIEQGVALMNVARYTRHFWEINKSRIIESRLERSEKKPWARLSKGGDFSRFYYDFDLVVLVQKDWDDMKKEIKERYPYLKGNSNLLIHPENHYFDSGITWPRRTQRGFNARFLPPEHVFADKGPTAFLKSPAYLFATLGILNSSLCEYLLKVLVSFGSWEVIGLRRIPFPSSTLLTKSSVEDLSGYIYETKKTWDTGNEICTRFDRPWVLKQEINKQAQSISSALDAVLDHEAELDDQLQTTYAELNDAVYRMYGVNDALRAKIEAAIGSRPPEIVWPQMEGRDRDQKRREHVDRLLCYLVKRVVEADEDGIVCLQRVFHEPPLIERLRRELAACFPEQDPNALETEVVNELKKKTKGYRRAESLTEWLHDAFFEIHNALYLQRPLLWHLASNQVRTEPGFACIVHSHRFTAEGLAKLRSVYLRDRITTLRREAAQAGQDNKEAERLELLALAEEVEEFDTKLKHLQEGAHTGTEGGDRDYRILTPWKSPAERPQGWNPDLDDGIKVNLAPLARTNLLRRKLKLGEAKEED